jgi:cell division protein FtsL
MKWKLLLRNLSVTSPEVAIRSQLPRSLRLLIVFFWLAAAAAAGVAIYEYGRTFRGPDRRELIAKVETLESKLRESDAELRRLVATNTAFESQLKVERAAQEQLVKQAQQAEAEAIRLREDLSFFESLLPTKGNATGIQIRSFRAQADVEPDTLRYRLLIQQAGKPERDFVGQVQMQIMATRDGKSVSIDVPESGDSAELRRSLELSFRHYQRVEGVLRLPDGAVARAVVVKIVAADKTLAQQNFQL